MTTPNCYRLWIGRPGALKAEIGRLLGFLRDGLPSRKVSLMLAPEETEGYDWIGAGSYADHDAEMPAGGMLAIRTSGTTGAPKTVTRDWSEVLARAGGRGEAADRWLLCYNPARWAGLSVISHVLRTGCRLAVPNGLDSESIVGALPQASHLSLTPSLFRRLVIIGADRLAAASVKQVTFGGEYARQNVLDTAKSLWPAARVTHVYASTELGDICSTSDGLEGIPVGKLRGRFELASDGELLIDNTKTGDYWKERGGRLHFQGRREDVVNVGGAKVHPSIVEAACRSISGITECRAFGIANPLLGQVVALEFTGDAEPQFVRRELAKRLPKVAVPVRADRVHDISLTSANKLARR